MDKIKRTIKLPPPYKSLAAYNKLYGILCALRDVPMLQPFRKIGRSLLRNAEPPSRILVQSSPFINSKTDSHVISVISANLWHDWPLHRDLAGRLERFASLVESEGADILLLQEIARTKRFKVDEWLASRLGMGYAYTRANGHHENGFEEGLGVFSRYPLSTPLLRQLVDNGNPFVRRLALGSLIQTPYGGLLAFSVHLSLTQRSNARQVENLRDWVVQVAGDQPALIGGDFNAHEDKPQIRLARYNWLDTFRHLNADADGTTHELRAPLGIRLARHRLDYIFYKRGSKDWQVLESRHLSLPDAPHSDHHAVLTRLTPALLTV